MLKSVWKDNGENKDQIIRRNSPRLSALNASKETQQKKKTVKASDGEKTGLPPRARTRVKRKFSNLAAKHVSEGKSRAQQPEDRSLNNVSGPTPLGRPSNWKATVMRSHYNGIPSKLPEKRILGLILDILQRRDSYEIFAEPVDPDEVKDYYEIIKKPMDFGTMRAKLHEGMYENLEEFEHDALLIPENAMNFNSPGTIYFRQARGILDLAKKVFHVLRTDPENFEVEFSGTRRRSIRKLQNETKEESSSKPHKDVKPDSTSNGSLFCLGVPSSLAGSSKGSPQFANKDRVFFPGNGDAQTSRSAEASRRSTYITWKSSPENQFPKPSILSNELKVNYTESLTRFVEDLGPTAKRIANKKLQSLQPNIQTPSYQVPTAYATFKMPSFFASNSASDQKPPDSLSGFGSIMKLNNTIKDISTAETANKPKNSNNKKKSRKNAEKKTQSSNKKPGGSSVIIDTRKPDDSKIRPVVLALEQSSHPNNTPSESKTRTKRSTNTSTPSTILAKSLNKPIPGSTCKDEADGSVSKHENTGQFFEKQPMGATSSLPLISRFTFNMPFLKSQLNQMNPPAAGQTTWDSSRLFETTTTRIAPRLFDQGSYLRFGSVMNIAPHQDEHLQQIPGPMPFISSINNAQSSWPSLAPPLDSDLSLQL